jgi:hypothetical protein
MGFDSGFKWLKLKSVADCHKNHIAMCLYVVFELLWTKERAFFVKINVDTEAGRPISSVCFVYFYASLFCSCSAMFRNILSFPSSRIKQWVIWRFDCLKMRPIGSHGTSLNNYQLKQRNNPEKRSFESFSNGGSLVSRIKRKYMFRRVRSLFPWPFSH